MHIRTHMHLLPVALKLPLLCWSLGMGYAEMGKQG